MLPMLLPAALPNAQALAGAVGVQCPPADTTTAVLGQPVAAARDALAPPQSVLLAMSVATPAKVLDRPMLAAPNIHQALVTEETMARVHGLQRDSLAFAHYVCNETSLLNFYCNINIDGKIEHAFTSPYSD
ncbi:UNVERIFIED_CONTAM: hypothetical protein K2H54_052650 [Gekko kuhli]